MRRRIGSWLLRQALRRRLLAVILLVTLVVMGTGAGATTYALSDFLYARIDVQVRQTAEELLRGLIHNPRDPLLSGLADTGAVGYVCTVEEQCVQLVGENADAVDPGMMSTVP